MIQKLKKRIVNNWPLKIGALVTTAALFFVVHGDDPATVTTTIPLRVTVPKDLVLAETLPDSVRISISGPRNSLKGFDATQLKPVILNLESVQDNSIVPIPFNQIELPTTLRVSDVQPEFLRVSLKPRETKVIPVQARLLGSPSVEYVVKNITENPRSVTVTGPRKSLDELSQLYTEPIPLNDIRETTTKQVHVRLDDPLLTFEDNPVISVTIETIATESKKTIETIEVIPLNTSRPLLFTPDSVQLELSGPTGVLDTIEPNNIKAVLDLSEYENYSPRKISLKPKIINLPPGIDIDSITPKVIIIDLLPIPQKAPVEDPS